MPNLNIHCKIDQRSIDRYVKEQKVLGDRITLSDQACAGLKLVINNRSSSWTYAYRKRGYIYGGKRHPQRTMKLGDPSTMSPAEARLDAETVKAQVRAGKDPALTARSAERARRAEEARKKSLLEWLGCYGEERMQSGATKYKRDELRNVRLSLDELNLQTAFPEELTSRHVRDLTDVHRERPATGRQRYGALCRFLDYLLDEEAIIANPALSVSKRRKPKPPAPRMNFFSQEQLKDLWALEGLKPEYLRYLRFMITTPLRAAEAAGLFWDQVDISRQEARLTADDTKNSEHFVMPLNALAQSVIGEASDPSLYVFQLSRNGGSMKAWSHFNKNVRKASGIDAFILHDLRRTFSTLMAEHTKVQEPLIDSLLNHKQSATRGGVIRHYQQAKHVEQRRDVMNRWGELLEGWL